MGDWSFAGGVKANPELYARYEVLERLGEGTYGEVYKGQRKSDGLVVALKETRDPQCAAREVEALLALNHPNVVKLIEYFVQGPNLILVLEFLPSDLYRELDGRDGRISEPEIKGWMLQILRGVAACHRASILHRDLKPSNLLVGADGSVKVADFGQARVVNLQTDDLLVENPFDGTCSRQIFGESGRMIMNASNHGHGYQDEPPSVQNLPSPLHNHEIPRNEEVTVEDEETEKAVRVLCLERVHNGTEGYIKEVECAEEGSAPRRPEKEGTIRFWDGDRERWESPYASDEDKGVEDPLNSKWFPADSDNVRQAANGLFFDDGSCPAEPVPGYFAFGDAEIEDSDQEEGYLACQTGWYGPPNVRDLYVKGIPEVGEATSQNEYVDEHSREAFEPYNDENMYKPEARSQHEDTQSTYSGESGNKGSDLSPFVGTRWYKAPELLYGAVKYGEGLDMWAIGCIFAELLSGKPLFPGVTDIDQLSRIVRVLGAPNDIVWPGVSSLPDFDKISFSDQRDLLSFRKLIPQASTSALKFLEKFLVYDPERRLSAETALKDVYFLEDPSPVPGDLKMPSFRRDSSPSEDWGEWRDPGSPFSDFEILDSAP
ncbi:cyclin-dependent kinase F-1 [Physcomitrium patens]|uniref:cyclin-dependent kinase n=1 Tax=Physcomitrium patens TaxID=3218 RepID=A0A2K1IMY5_PHYPA|nr:cyclin-dependent kinase F-1-like [Physcomitrium patens]PNR30634.1 hypothetical protein PHYPA_026950 [Physcomitrium patens]|eukprot:XP_024361360.1 cyclin-dependent kinase F-1-like [Physcomitrella patens]